MTQKNIDKVLANITAHYGNKNINEVYPWMLWNDIKVILDILEQKSDRTYDPTRTHKEGETVFEDEKWFIAKQNVPLHTHPRNDKL